MFRIHASCRIVKSWPISPRQARASCQTRSGVKAWPISTRRACGAHDRTSLFAARQTIWPLQNVRAASTEVMPAKKARSESEGRALAVRVTLWGAVTNVGLAVFKYGAGHLSGSSALVADAAHSLSDLLSDIVTLFVVHFARLPPDDDHPYGHGRFEAVGSLSVAAILVVVAGGVGWSSLSTLSGLWFNGAVENSLAMSEYGSLAIAACVTSLVAKEALYQATAYVGREVGSQTLMANAWHHRSDALSSVGALVGVGGSMAGIPILDPAAGLLVAVLVAKAGVEIGWEAFGEVTEKAALNDETREAVKTMALSTAGVLGVDQLRTRKMGPYSLVDLRIVVDPYISVSAARQVAELLRHKILTHENGVSDAVVHVTPQTLSGSFADAAPLMRPHPVVESDVRAVLKNVPEVRGVAHVITHYVPHEGIHLKVDIMCDDHITVREAAIIAHAARLQLQTIDDIFHVDVDLELPDI